MHCYLKELAFQRKKAGLAIFHTMLITNELIIRCRIQMLNNISAFGHQ